MTGTDAPSPCATPSPKFWERQFASKRTPKQLGFDVAFGLVMPVVCLIADPFIFKGGLFHARPLLGRIAVLAYLLIAIGIVALCTRLLLKSTSALLAGALMAGAVFSAVLGVALLPFSLIGLMVYGIGALGFTPFLTGFVFLRNGIATLHEPAASPRRARINAACLSFAATFLVPVAAQVSVTCVADRALEAVLSDDEASAEVAAGRLKWLHQFTEIDRLLSEYEKETDEARKQRLAAAYRKIAGEDIQAVLDWRKD